MVETLIHGRCPPKPRISSSANRAARGSREGEDGTDGIVGVGAFGHLAPVDGLPSARRPLLAQLKTTERTFRASLPYPMRGCSVKESPVQFGSV